MNTSFCLSLCLVVGSASVIAFAETSSDIKSDISRMRGPDESASHIFEGTCLGFPEKLLVGRLIEPEEEIKALRDGEGLVFCRMAPGSTNEIKITNTCSADSPCEVKGKQSAQSNDTEVEIVEARVIKSLPGWRGTCYGEIKHEGDGYYSVGSIDNLGAPCGFFAASVSKTILETCPLGSICGVTGRFEKMPEAPLSNSDDSPKATIGYVDSVKMDRAPSNNNDELQNPSVQSSALQPEVEQCNDPSVLKTITATNLDKYRSIIFAQDRETQMLITRVVSANDTERMKVLFKEKLKYSVINIRQSSFDSQNNTRYCSATYAIQPLMEPDATFSLNYIRSVAMILQATGALSNSAASTFCQNGPITFKIERLLDKAGFYVSWDCQHRPQ